MWVETRLYYREKYVSLALSRLDDVGKALIDWETYRSGRGSILEFIRAWGWEKPPMFTT